MFGHTDNQQTNNPGMPGQPNPNPMATNDPATQVASVADQTNLGVIPAASDPLPPPTNPFSIPAAQPVFETSQQPSYGATPSAPVASTTVPDSTDLLDLKQKALQELSPLVGQLSQNPEEKFKTTMMMIQASDDQALLPVAYEAAQAITDEKAKAQALLDVVNEINYFTQSH